MNYGVAVIGNQFTFEGIDAQDKVDCLIAETPHEYLSAISDLIDNSVELINIGNRSRQLIEAKYNSHYAGESYLKALEFSKEPL